MKEVSLTGSVRNSRVYVGRQTEERMCFKPTAKHDGWRFNSGVVFRLLYRTDSTLTEEEDHFVLQRHAPPTGLISVVKDSSCNRIMIPKTPQNFDTTTEDQRRQRSPDSPGQYSTITLFKPQSPDLSHSHLTSNTVTEPQPHSTVIRALENWETQALCRYSCFLIVPKLWGNGPYAQIVSENIYSKLIMKCYEKILPSRRLCFHRCVSLLFAG